VVQLDVLARRKLATPRPKRFETSPIARSFSGSTNPAGSFTRSMNVPILGLSW